MCPSCMVDCRGRLVQLQVLSHLVQLLLQFSERRICGLRCNSYLDRESVAQVQDERADGEKSDDFATTELLRVHMPTRIYVAHILNV